MPTYRRTPSRPFQPAGAPPVAAAAIGKWRPGERRAAPGAAAVGPALPVPIPNK